jgi:hypothetical protein
MPKLGLQSSKRGKTPGKKLTIKQPKPGQRNSSSRSSPSKRKTVKIGINVSDKKLEREQEQKKKSKSKRGTEIELKREGISGNADMWGENEEKRTAMVSSELLKNLFGTEAKDYGKLARVLTEVVTPQTQGKNAYTLSKFIVAIKPSPKNPYYEQAKFFKELYESNTCYICGKRIHKQAKVEELEHICPLAEAMAILEVITEGMKEFSKKLKDYATSKSGLFYLLEYARAHTCCNQVKGKLSFFKFDPNGNPVYSIDRPTLRFILEEIWKNSVGKGTFRQELFACGNAQLKKDLETKSKESWIKEREDYLIQYHLNPILKQVNGFIHGTSDGQEGVGLPFASLVYSANQALSVSTEVWTKMGIQWRGTSVSPEALFDSVRIGLGQFNQFKYAEGDIITSLWTLQSTNTTFRGQLLDYYDKRISAQNPSRRAGRLHLDLSNFTRFISYDYGVMKKLYLQYLNAKGIQSVDEHTFFALEFAQSFIMSQGITIPLYSDMKDHIVKLAVNMNKYTILYIMSFVILFDVINNNSLPDQTQIEALEKFLMENFPQMVGIHQYLMEQTFLLFKHMLNVSGNFSLNAKDIGAYPKYVTLSHFDIQTAETITLLKDRVLNDYAVLEAEISRVDAATSMAILSERMGESAVLPSRPKTGKPVPQRPLPPGHGWSRPTMLPHRNSVSKMDDSE